MRRALGARERGDHLVHKAGERSDSQLQRGVLAADYTHTPRACRRQQALTDQVPGRAERPALEVRSAQPAGFRKPCETMLSHYV